MYWQRSALSHHSLGLLLQDRCMIPGAQDEIDASDGMEFKSARDCMCRDGFLHVRPFLCLSGWNIYRVRLQGLWEWKEGSHADIETRLTAYLNSCLQFASQCKRAFRTALHLKTFHTMLSDDKTCSTTDFYVVMQPPVRSKCYQCVLGICRRSPHWWFYRTGNCPAVITWIKSFHFISSSCKLCWALCWNFWVWRRVLHVGFFFFLGNTCTLNLNLISFEKLIRIDKFIFKSHRPVNNR